MTGWYLMRATGIVSLVLFTLVTVLGIATAARLGPRRTPRFVTLALHRNLSLLAVVFVGIHVVTALLDPYAHVSALAAIVPFTAHWRPLAVGLGTVALDVVAALIVTSMLRRHLSLLLWRSVHLLAFVSWPVAIWHTIGAGSDWSTGWARAIVLACVAAVVAAVLRRLPRPGRLAKHLAAQGRS